MTTTASSAAPGRLPLRRLPRSPSRYAPRTGARPWLARPGALVSGVGAGLAAHFGIPVVRVRLVLVALCLVKGSGLLLYVLLTALVPRGDPWEEAVGARPPARSRLASRLGQPVDTWLTPRLKQLLGGGALLLAALLLLAWRQGALGSSQDIGVVGPMVLVAAGTALAWSQAEAITSDRRDWGALTRLVGGVSLAGVGILLWIGADTPPRALLTGAVIGVALVLVTALVLTPVWLRTNRALADSRAEQAREAERADIAAHLHDSVLQTLTLIRASAEDPARVRAIALTEERELRAWLYTGHAQAADSLEAAVTEAVVGVESRYGVPVSAVVVGDMRPGPAELSLVAALAEASQNAVRHGAPPVSVYVEVRGRVVEAFVKDHGEGFDPGLIADDRHGVRDSIVGRMRRVGGEASIRSGARGTEISLRVPRSDILEETAPNGRTQ